MKPLILIITLITSIGSPLGLGEKNLYLMHHADSGLYKIGSTSRDIDQRIYEMDYAVDCQKNGDIVLVDVWGGRGHLEKDIHKMLDFYQADMQYCKRRKGRRINSREWYDLSECIMEDIYTYVREHE